MMLQVRLWRLLPREQDERPAIRADALDNEHVRDVAGIPRRAYRNAGGAPAHA